MRPSKPKKSLIERFHEHMMSMYSLLIDLAVILFARGLYYLVPDVHRSEPQLRIEGIQSFLAAICLVLFAIAWNLRRR